MAEEADRPELPFGPRSDIEREEAIWWIRRTRKEQLQGARDYQSRTPCAACGITDAVLIPRGGQNTVRCARCGLALYNAPKAETGEAPRTVTTLRSGIKPGQQAHILDRDNGRCVLCGRSDQPITIGHLLSIEDGLTLGVSAALLNDDANLAAMCEACNLGLSGRSVSPRTYGAIMYRLVQAEAGRAANRHLLPPVAVRAVPNDGRSS